MTIGYQDMVVPHRMAAEAAALERSDRLQDQLCPVVRRGIKAMPWRHGATMDGPTPPLTPMVAPISQESPEDPHHGAAGSVAARAAALMDAPSGMEAWRKGWNNGRMAAMVAPFGQIRKMEGVANGMEWNGMEWNGMEWNGMEWKRKAPPGGRPPPEDVPAAIALYKFPGAKEQATTWLGGW